MRQADLLHLIRESIATELEIDEADLNDRASLREDYGLESVAAVNIVFRLEELLDRAIDIRDFVDIDTIADLEQLLSRIQNGS